MRHTWKLWLAMGLLAACGTAAMGQTTVALSGYGAFSGTTNSGGTAQSPSNSAGAMVELRHQRNPLMGYEATYSWNRANQAYTYSPQAICGLCEGYTTWTPVPSNAHEITGDWVVSMHVLNVRPFVLAGGGLLFNQPSSSTTTTTTYTSSCGGVPGICSVGYSTSTTATRTETKGVFVYGAGLDWGLLPHLGLRFQYRGNLYKAPNLTALYTSTDKFTHTAEPMIGAYFRF